MDPIALRFPEMKWPGKGRKQSGEFQLLPPGQPVILNHYVEVEGWDNARLIAEQLHGFRTSVGLSPTDNGIGPTRYQITVSHAYVPDGKKTKGGSHNTTPEMALSWAQKAISEVIRQVPGSRYAGWDRNPMPPQTRDHDDDDDSPAGLPLPLRS
jgi:hypothetical protein